MVKDYEPYIKAIEDYMAHNMRYTQKEVASKLGVSSATLSGWLSRSVNALNNRSIASIRNVCGRFIEQPANPAPAQLSTPASASAAPTAQQEGAQCAYRKRVLEAIMAMDSVDIDDRLHICEAVKAVE